MKIFLFTIVLLTSIFLVNNNNFAVENNFCGTTTVTSTTHLPPTGTINILVVFAQFYDDTESSASWPVDHLPIWSDDFINSSTGGPYAYNNLSQYYNEMSNGDFQVIGDVYDHLVITDRNETSYNSIGEVNYEILTEIDPFVDFSEYDNLNGNVPGTDDIVDYIAIIYRNSSSLMSYTGVARLDLNPTIIYTDGKTIVDGSFIRWSELVKKNISNWKN